MKKTYAQIRADLNEFLGPHCPGITIEVGRNPRWKRTCLTFRWDGFVDMLVEERFRRIAFLIPPDYFETVCRDVVWLELSNDETVETYLAKPRSEDIDENIPAIWTMLNKAGFFKALADELGARPGAPCPPDRCPDDLSTSKRLLAAKKTTSGRVTDACLAFMRHKAYCDCSVLTVVRPIAEKKLARPRRTSSQPSTSRRDP